jgi:hypothetical protein
MYVCMYVCMYGTFHDAHRVCCETMNEFVASFFGGA